MKKSFQDKSYIEIKKDGNGILIIISATDSINSLKKIINAVSISKEDFDELVKSVND